MRGGEAKVFVEYRGKRYEVVRCGEKCSFCTADSPDEHCFKRCYVPNAIFNAISRINDHGCGFREVAG